MKILIAGGTGLIGTQIIQEWSAEGHELQILTRGKSGKSTENSQIMFVHWDGITIPQLNFKAEIILNLAGAGIADHSWTPARRKLLLDSRVQSTRACVNYIRQQSPDAQVFINANAVGYYGAGTQKQVNEKSPAGSDFLAQVSIAWEQEALRAPIRTVILRTGIVLDKNGGALAKLLPLFQTGLGSWLGSGRQAFPWIHLKDVTQAIRWLSNQPEIQGPVNLAAPGITDNKGFSKTLASVLKRPCVFKVPAFVLKLALGERATLLLQGQQVHPEVLLSNHYPFLFPELAPALRDILK